MNLTNQKRKEIEQNGGANGSGENGESPEGPSKNLVLELLPAIASPNAEGVTRERMGGFRGRKRNRSTLKCLGLLGHS
ncbi:hypothetical protein TNCV_3921501 [Trichonephila clavipes]|nr:hypothetical protein TNCV_3921501 [Trichonephila clavipes]